MGTCIMTNSKGFTLIELLFVLVIVSTISIFVLPSMYETLTKQQRKHFFQMLENDVFLIQNYSLYSNSNNRILVNKEDYIVRTDSDYIFRKYPHDFRLINNYNRIRFSVNGTVYDPTTYIFQDQNGLYKVVFPFGKGRFYIDE